MAERWLATQWPVLSRATRASQEGHSLLPEDSQRTPSSLSRPEPTRSSTVDGLRAAMSPGRSERAFRSGNERLYEAYNDLHALAQDFEKPFDAPAILVVGHQTDGKSGPRRGRWAGGFLALRLALAWQTWRVCMAMWRRTDGQLDCPEHETCDFVMNITSYSSAHFQEAWLTRLIRSSVPLMAQRWSRR